ncbi:MAG: hypothetical protein AAF798_15250 [Bacteroidota bacterium]
MKKSILIFVALFVGTVIQAQTVSDALRLSSYQIGGTARTVGVGGSMSALGTDFATIAINPAGLAQYRKSEFSITPTLLVTDTESALTEGSFTPLSTDSRTNFNLNNLGVVFARRPRASRWKTANFALGFNRIANFNRKFFYEGSSEGSIVDRFQEQANANDSLDPFESELAFNAGALLCCDDDNLYVSDVELAPPGAEIFRDELVTTRGSINEILIGFAGNYDDKISIGATIGIPIITYTEERIYREEDQGTSFDGDIPFFDELEYGYNLTTTGAGLNLKLGFIYRLNQMFRFGFSAHTPSIFWLDDSFNANLAYEFTEDNESFRGEETSPDGIFDYQLRTPWRLIASTGIVIGKYGFISGEVEWVDYTNLQFDLGQETDTERFINRAIEEDLSAAINARLGGEIAIERFRVRAGINFLQSAIEGDDSFNTAYSFGAGIRERSFFLDFAYRITQVEENYFPYTTAETPIQVIDNSINNNQFMLTAGFRF